MCLVNMRLAVLKFVARDTRISGEMLESALVAGLLSVGIEVYKLGYLRHLASHTWSVQKMQALVL